MVGMALARTAEHATAPADGVAAATGVVTARAIDTGKPPRSAGTGVVTGLGAVPGRGRGGGLRATRLPRRAPAGF
ncbi:hypothetical protein [Streptomyces sp. NPDC086777]|uniref:hypothetical protein n=1 Tax=Streptomyces sp. NPDC086777 TaxID=3154866 RepID=UPI003450CFA2